MQAHLAKRIWKVYETEILHSSTLRECRPLHGQPFDLPNKVTIIDRYQKVAINARERAWPARIQSYRFRRFNIECNLDFVR